MSLQRFFFHSIFFFFFLQMIWVHIREVKKLAQGHKASPWEVWG